MPTPSVIKSAPLVALTSASLCPVWAQDTTPAPRATPATNSSATVKLRDKDEKKPFLSGLVIKYGYQRSLDEPHTSKTSRQITYRDKPVGRQDDALKFLDPTAQFLQPYQPEKASDVPRFFFNLEEGKAQVNGGFLEAFQLDPFNFHPAFLRGFRLSARAGGDFKGKERRATLGLEAPSIRLSSFGIGNGTNLTNYLRFGLGVDQRWRNNANGGDKTVAIATYRGFIGKTIGWKHDRETPFTIDEFLKETKKVPDPSNPSPYDNKISYQGLEDWGRRQGDADFEPGSIKEVLSAALGQLDALNRNTTPSQPDSEEPKDQAKILQNKLLPTNLKTRGGQEDVDKNVDNFIRDMHIIYEYYMAGYRLRPINTLGLEYQGWYNIKAIDSEKRFNHSLAFTATHNFSIRDVEGSFIQFKFDLGRDYGAPTDVKRLIGINTGFQF